MRKPTKIRAALLAAASLTAASAATHVHASPADVPAISIEHVVAADHADQADKSQEKAGKFALAALAAGVLAAIVKLIGIKRLMRAAGEIGPVVAKGARAAAQAPVKAAKAIGSAMASPVKFAALMASLGLCAFLGVGFFDLEWTAGLAVGAAMTALAWYGTEAAKRTLSLRRVKVSTLREKESSRDDRPAR